jgi:hypothetical protein
MDNFNLKDHAWIAIPLSVYILTSLTALFIRRDLSHYFTRDLPRMGSEFCKISCAILLAAIAIGLDSYQFRETWLGKRPDAVLMAALMLVMIIVVFMASFLCSYTIEGRNVLRAEVTWRRWFFAFFGGQALGLLQLGLVFITLKGRSA